MHSFVCHTRYIIRYYTWILFPLKGLRIANALKWNEDFQKDKSSSFKKSFIYNKERGSIHLFTTGEKPAVSSFHIRENRPRDGALKQDGLPVHEEILMKSNMASEREKQHVFLTDRQEQSGVKHSAPRCCSIFTRRTESCCTSWSFLA